MPIDWDAQRKRIIQDPTIINLNTGSFGPVPRVVFDRANAHREQLAAEPTDFFVRRVPPLLWHARERLASFLNSDPKRLVFTSNVSSAINLVLSGIRLSSPGEILLTDHEYGAMHWCCERFAQRQGLTLRTFPLPTMANDPGEIVEAFRRALRPQTRIAFFSHILSPTGLVLPAAEMCREARRLGVMTLIDGAHAPAMIPLDVGAINADFYAGNCHKWLLAPSGSGFLVIGPGNEDRVQPLEVSWGYHYDRSRADERDEFGSTPRTRFLEFEGTRDICPWLVTPDAIDFQTEIGWDAVRGRIAELAGYVRRRMSETLGLPPATPDVSRMRGSLTSFRLPDGIDAKRLREAIWKHRIEIPIVERPDRLLIRFSTHFYNLESEIDRLLEVLPDALQFARVNG